MRGNKTLMKTKQRYTSIAVAAIAVLAICFLMIASEVHEQTEGDPGDVEIVYQAISYRLDSTNHTAIVIKGANSYIGDIVVPDKVTYGGNEYTVKGMEESFSSFTALTSVELPAGVTTIPEDAFAGCTALKRIHAPGVTTIERAAFSYCSSLKRFDFTNITNIEANAFDSSGLIEAELHETSIKSSAFNNSYALRRVVISNVETIGNEAFYYCASLESVSLSNITKIGETAFGNCTALTEIAIPSSVNKIDHYAFRDCTALSFINLEPASPTIGVCAFDTKCKLGTVVKTELPIASVKIEANFIHYNTNLSVSNSASFGFSDAYSVGDLSITITDGAMSVTGSDTTVANSIFKNGENDYTEVITSIQLHDGVTIIGDEAFKGCKALRAINMPDGLETLGISAFYDCGALRSMVLPEGITVISEKAFMECRALSSITLSEKTTNIGDEAFNLCNGLESVDLPHGLTSIGKSAFYSCQNIVALTIPDSATIDVRSFEHCLSLRDVVLPNDLTIIPEAAFFDTRALSHISLPESLEVIGDSAFAYSGVINISIPKNVRQLGNWVFQECIDLESVTIHDATVLGENPFSICDTIKNFSIYVGDAASDEGILNKYFSSGAWELDVISQSVSHVKLEKADPSKPDWEAFKSTIYNTAPSDGTPQKT